MIIRIDGGKRGRKSIMKNTNWTELEKKYNTPVVLST